METVLHSEGYFSTPSPLTGPHSTENIFKLISALSSPVSLSFTTFIFVFPEEEALSRLTFSLHFFFSVYLNLGTKHKHGNVQTSAEPQKPQHLSGLEVRQKSWPPPFKCLGEGVNLFTEIWGPTYFQTAQNVFAINLCSIWDTEALGLHTGRAHAVDWIKTSLDS